MLSTELRRRIYEFRAKLRSLPGYLSGACDIELELDELVAALGSLREEARQLSQAVKDERLRQAQELERQAAERAAALEAQAAPAPVSRAVAVAAEPSVQEPSAPPISIQLPHLTGPQVLAWSGGIVTLLGIVFFFIFATNRGWIGPIERVFMGAIASALVFGAGVWARRRYEVTIAALTSVGAGIAGGYATLLAAASLYHFLPTPAALAVAAAIAAIGVGTALAWDSETIAAFGLIGAMLVPAAIILQGGVTTTGTAFVAAALAAAGFVAVLRRWDGLLFAAAVVGAPQIALFLAGYRHETRPSTALPVAAAFSLVYLALGVTRQLLHERKALQDLPVSLLLTSAAIAATSASRLYHGYADETTLRGQTLLVVAAGYGLVGSVVFLRRTNRDLASLLIALGLTAAAIAGVDLLSGATLAISWSAEAALLGWLSWLTKEARFRLSAVAYLALALGHTLVIDAPPTQLFTIVYNPTAGLSCVVAVALATLAIAVFSHDSKRPRPSSIDLLLCSPAAAYAAALVLVRLGEDLLGVDPRGFALGHVLIVSFLAASALGFVVTGNGRSDTRVWIGGLGLLGVTFAEVVFLTTRSADLRWYGLFPFAAALYATALSEAVPVWKKTREISPVGGTSLLAAAFSVAVGLHELAGDTLEGTLGLAVAATIALTAVPLARRRELRDESTLFWVVAVALAAYDVQLLLSGQALALSLSGSALVLLALSELTRERRLELAALGAGVWALGHVFSCETPGKVFFQQVHSPLKGFPSLLALVVVALGFAWRLRRAKFPPHASSWALVAGGALALLSSWLGLIGIGAQVGNGPSSFHWAQSSATMLLAGSGAVAVTCGRARVWPRLWLFGTGAFAIALLKLVAFDLGELSATARGTVMLVIATSLLAAALAEELLGQDLDFARPWAGLAPFNLVSIPLAVVLSVAGIEAVAARTPVTGIDLAASLEIVTGAALFVLALALRLLRRDAATLLGASAFAGYLFGLLVLVAQSSALSARDIAPGLAITVMLLAACLRASGERRVIFPLAGTAAAAILTTLSDWWTPVDHLLKPGYSSANGIPVLVLLALALCSAALAARNVEGFDWRRLFALASAAVTLYAVSLLVLDVAQWLGGWTNEPFLRGHVVLLALWGVTALAARELSRSAFRGASTVAFAISLGLLALLDLHYQWLHFGPYERAAGCAVLALCALASSVREQLLGREAALKPLPVVLELGAFALAVVADHQALSSLRAQGLGLVALAALAALLATALYRFTPEERDFAVLSAATAVVLAVVGIELASTEVALVVDGVDLTSTVAVFCLSALALLVMLTGLRVSEWRLLTLAVIPIAVGLWTSVAGDASPRYLFHADAHPGRGVPALAALIATGALVVWAARRIRIPDDWAELVEELSGYLRWALGVGALYLLSLTVLEIAQVVSPGTLASGLQRGHAAISACWGVLGLIFLYLGLTRTSRAIRLAGLTLFGASVAKVFLYDLPSLSSVQRAVSFLAVGAMLLAGGFFYQRLAARLTDV